MKYSRAIPAAQSATYTELIIIIIVVIIAQETAVLTNMSAHQKRALELKMNCLQFVKRLMNGIDDSFPTLSFALIIKSVWMLLPWIAKKHTGPATLNVFAILSDSPGVGRRDPRRT